MKDIKFRAWAIASQKMFYPDTADGWDIDSGKLSPLPNTILMQYTGINTEDGAEIYEGDICDPDGVVGQYLIEWSDHYGRVMARGISYIYGGNLEVSSMARGEIVGTVHQNPELLENPK